MWAYFSWNPVNFGLKFAFDCLLEFEKTHFFFNAPKIDNSTVFAENSKRYLSGVETNTGSDLADCRLFSQIQAIWFRKNKNNFFINLQVRWLYWEQQNRSCSTILFRYSQPSPVFINVIREPVDRFISRFYYRRYGFQDPRNKNYLTKKQKLLPPGRLNMVSV